MSLESSARNAQLMQRQQKPKIENSLGKTNGGMVAVRNPATCPSSGKMPKDIHVLRGYQTGQRLSHSHLRLRWFRTVSPRPEIFLWNCGGQIWRTKLKPNVCSLPVAHTRQCISTFGISKYALFFISTLEWPLGELILTSCKIMWDLFLTHSLCSFPCSVVRQPKYSSLSCKSPLPCGKAARVL